MGGSRGSAFLLAAMSFCASLAEDVGLREYSPLHSASDAPSVRVADTGQVSACSKGLGFRV